MSTGRNSMSGAVKAAPRSGLVIRLGAISRTVSAVWMAALAASPVGGLAGKCGPRLRLTGPLSLFQKWDQSGQWRHRHGGKPTHYRCDSQPGCA